jgi:hypothetical protein
MMQDLYQLTNQELRLYISEHRNNADAFHAALEVLVSRSNPENVQPYPFTLADPEAEVTALLKQKLNIQD